VRRRRLRATLETMNASPTIGAPSKASAPPRAPRSGSETMQVPARWRLGQFLVIALIALAAGYYYTKGWRSPPGANPAQDSRSIGDLLGFGILALFTWLCTPAVGVIAVTTVQEALRRRWIVVLTGFAVVMLAFSGSFTGLQPGEEERFLQDFGTLFISTITLLIAIFLGVSLVPPDIERRTIFTILSKPVNRTEFVLGKYLGLCTSLALALFLMSAAFLIAYTLFVTSRYTDAWAGSQAASRLPLGWTLGNLANALILHYGQLVVMAAMALTLSLFVSSITAIVFCFLAYFGGQMSSYWQNLGGRAGAEGDASTGISRGMQGVVNVVYYALPRLDRFDVHTQLAADTPIAFNTVWKAWDSGLIYSAILLTIAVLVFSDREF
jgi:Cu-processing system permease protein